jgi:predicted transcriptional regulator
MKSDGRELQQIQQELGLSPIEVCAEADISMTTLYKVYGNKPVSTSSANRVRKALSRLSEKAASKNKAKAVG